MESLITTRTGKLAINENEEQMWAASERSSFWHWPCELED